MRSGQLVCLLALALPRALSYNVPIRAPIAPRHASPVCILGAEPSDLAKKNKLAKVRSARLKVGEQCIRRSAQHQAEKLAKTL